jgi:hypothetical protein
MGSDSPEQHNPTTIPSSGLAASSFGFNSQLEGQHSDTQHIKMPATGSTLPAVRLHARSYRVREFDWLVRTIQLRTAAMLGAAWQAHVRRTVHQCCQPADVAVVDAWDITTAAPAEDRGTGGATGSGCSSGGLETSPGCARGGPEPAELQATQVLLWCRTGDVAQRRRWRTGAG